MKRSQTYERIYEVVRQIPPGHVATYGQVAALAGMPGQARLVGYALNSLPDDHDVPWQRVINAQGRISERGDPEWEDFQRILLKAEGVVSNEDGAISLVKYRWEPGEHEDNDSDP
jgi:methylated-DNA-protein-cysteine methyltransferase-like protein